MTRPRARRARRGRAKSARSAFAEVLEYFGVAPEKVIDVQALAGDSTDHVPGARGIGVKTAAQLIAEYGDLDALLARAAEIKQPKRREILTEPESVALIKLSKQLVTLVRDVDLDVSLDELGLHAPDAEDARRLLKGDGIHNNHQTRRRIFRHRRGGRSSPIPPLWVAPAGAIATESKSRRLPVPMRTRLQRL